MYASAMIDKAKQILARTDVDRPLMLFFINTAIRAVLRDKSIHKFYTSKVMPHVNGLIDGLMIKHAVDVFYTNADGISRLKKLADFKAAMYYYPDFTQTGTPAHYFEDGGNIQILPVPTEGTLTVYGEFWPDDLTDSINSTNVLTVELPEAFIYLGAAEYFDYFDEMQKGQYWRQKGMTIVDSYIKQSAKQTLHKISLDQDPLGNGGI